MATTAEGPRVPITGGPRAKSHQDARALATQAQDALDRVKAGKRTAALKDPESVGADYAAKAAGKRFVGASAFDRLSTGRTTE